MINPLIIDSNYCIVNNAAGQISRTFWEHIDHNHIDPTILCGVLDDELHLSNRLIPVKDRPWIRKCLGVFRRLGFPDLYYIPDTEWYSWSPVAYRKVVAESRKYDYIHSISSPQSNHLLAKKLKKHYNIPWIAQFDDPWHDTSGRKYKYVKFEKYDLKLEREVAEEADVIIHSNDVIRDIWVERYGESVANKIVILPFNFNIYDLPEVKPIPSNEKLEISHIGHIYSTRSAMTVFRALEILISDNPEIANKLHFTFIGGIHKNEKQYVHDSCIKEMVTFIPTLPPEQLEEYYQKSNIFLIIDINIPRSPNYPSKLMMYFYYQRPIIGITNPQCQLVKELNETRNTCFYYGESKKLANMLKDVVSNYNNYTNFDKNYWKRHTVENVQKLYCQLLREKLNINI